MSYLNWLPNGHQYLLEYGGFYIDTTVFQTSYGELDDSRYVELIDIITGELLNKFDYLEEYHEYNEKETTILTSDILRVVVGGNNKYAAIYVVTQPGYPYIQKQCNEFIKCLNYLKEILLENYTNYVFKRKGDTEVQFVG